MSRRGASPFSVAQRPLRAGRATKPARFYDEVRDRDGAAREENRQRQGADEAREFFSPFFFAGPFSRPQALPQEKAFGSPLPRSSPLISTSHQQEDRLAPVTRVELGKLKVRRLFWRRAEPRTKQGERFNRRRQREREREARSAAASAREQSRRRGSWISSSSKPRPSSSSKPSLFSSKNTDRRPPPLRCGLRPRRLRDLHAGRADEGHRPALGRAGEFSISFFFFPTPCLSLAVPARALFVFLSPPFLSFPLSSSFFLLPLFSNLRTSIVASP